MSESEQYQFKSVAKQFEYEKLSREIDGCTDVDELRKMLKQYIQLHFRTQETLITDLMQGVDRG